jgi:hypothetical protein
MAGVKAPDTLREDAAQFVRQAIRDVRALKSLTNQKIARRLRWDVRRVTSALVDSSRLRQRKAREILKALSSHIKLSDDRRYLEPNDREAARLIEKALSYLRFTETPAIRLPAVLIPKGEVTRIAAFLASELASRKPGIQREALERELRGVLARKRNDLAGAFAFWWRIVSTSATAPGYAKALSEFGDPDVFAGIFRSRGLIAESTASDSPVHQSASRVAPQAVPQQARRKSRKGNKP